MSQNFNKITPNTELVDPVFLTFMLNSEIVQRQFLRNITDTVRTFLSLTKLKKVSVPLAPLSVQQEFSALAIRINSQRDIHLRGLTMLDELFASLQSRAFKGAL